MKPSSIIVALAGLLSLLAFGSVTEAQIVYTPANISITGNASLKLDLNHDGVTDLNVVSLGKSIICGGPLQFYHGPGRVGVVTATPTVGNRVVASARWVAALGYGVEIDSSQSFNNGQLTMMGFNTCVSGNLQGYWYNVTGYLGLEFLINGEIHYGWARLRVSTPGPTVTLKGYAYETTAGRAIKTGEE